MFISTNPLKDNCGSQTDRSDAMKVRLKQLFWCLALVLSLFMLTKQATVKADTSFDIDPVTIDVAIQPDGTAKVKEQYVYRFDGEFNGLLYDLDTNDLPEDPQNFKLTITRGGESKEATENSSEQPFTYEQTNASGIWKNKIFIPGDDETVILQVDYDLPHFVINYNDTAQYNRKLIGSNWSAGLSNVTATIRLPEPVESGELKGWAHGALSGDITIGDDNQTVTLKIPYNPAGQFMEANIVFPTRIVQANTNVVAEDKLDQIMSDERAMAEETANQIKREQEQKEKAARIGKFLIGGTSLLAIGTFVLNGYVLYKKRQDLNRLKENIPDHLFEPPSDIKPALLKPAVYGKEVGADELSATIMDLVRRHVIEIAPIEKSVGKLKKAFGASDTDYRLTLLSDHDERLDDYEKHLIDWYFNVIGDRQTVTLDEVEAFAKKKQKRFRGKYTTFTTKVKSDAKGFGYIADKNTSKKSDKGIGGFVAKVSRYAFVGTILIGAVIVLVPRLNFLDFGQYIFPYIFISMAILIAMLMINVVISFLYPKNYTKEGIVEKQKWDAFTQMLKDISTLDMAEVGSIILWEKYLVYAIVLGEAEKVAKAMETYIPPEQLDQGYLASMYYYHGASSLMFQNRLTQSNATAIASSTPSSSGSNYSGGGGGFSGGSSGGSGGGGGGGAF